jgi:hypothetical protein
MSRAYRIRVSESLKRVLRAADRVSTQLELLEILPREQLAEQLAEELERRGFQRRGKSLVRQGNGVTVSVEPETGTVTVRAETAKEVEIEGERAGAVYDEQNRAARKRSEEALREALRQDLQRHADKKTAQLQQEVTDRLEAQLGGLRQELDQVVNRVTAEALKRKAAHLGQIKEMTEDPQSGSLTIVLEV